MAEDRDTQGQRCSDCGEIIGVYEPIVILANGEAPRRTSLAAEADLPTDGVVVHEACFARRPRPSPSSTQSTLRLDS